MTQTMHSTLERAPSIGDAIGHYRIIGVVGDGSLGRLYLAEQHGIRGVSKTVALRCIRPELARNAGFRALFFDAASVAPRFEHPNVVTIHEMGELEGRCFISMEYLPAENVASILTTRDTGAHVPPDIAASLVQQTANAVQYLHDFRAATARTVGVGHGGVHPSNVFVTYHGTVKWLGVGHRPMSVANSAASSGAHRVDTSSRAISYLPPEQLEGGADPRVDVFSLGALLWTCLTGHRPPLALANDGAVGLSQRRVAPSSVRADVPEALDAIVARALSLDPRERFQSARELSEALDRYLIRRDSRPTPKHVRRWMEQSFDADRAALQMKIAQGREVEAALALLDTLQPVSGASSVAHSRASLRPRELWSTSHSVFSRLDRGSIASLRSIAPLRSFEPGPGLAAPRAGPSRAWMVALLIATCAVIAMGAALILSSSNQSSPFREASPDSQLAVRSGRVEVRSTPEGAAVFVDGEPTGLRTPVVLKGLAEGRSLMLRVDKAGFASQQREIEIVGGALETEAFELLASDGLVHFGGAPADTRIYVDEKAIAVEDGKAVSLSVGRHELRVETPSSLIFSGTVVVVAGEQTIRVDDLGANP